MEKSIFKKIFTPVRWNVISKKSKQSQTQNIGNLISDSQPCFHKFVNVIKPSDEKVFIQINLKREQLEYQFQVSFQVRRDSFTKLN